MKCKMKGKVFTFPFAIVQEETEKNICFANKRSQNFTTLKRETPVPSPQAEHHFKALKR